MAHPRLSLVLALLAATALGGQAAEQSPAVLAAGDLGARTVSYVYEAHASRSSRVAAIRATTSSTPSRAPTASSSAT
jgi:endonuclease/exonuclease/phosphatase family metal-dependent hydrolase